MDAQFLKKIYATHQVCTTCPSPADVASFFDTLLGALFADFTQLAHLSEAEFATLIDKLQKDLDRLLQQTPQAAQVSDVTQAFFEAVPALYDTLQDDVTGIFSGDPAATNRSQVIRTYPGFYAIAAYRFAHQLYLLGVEDLPRIITEYAHSKTGIDIHPSAQIGTHFCIDHGTGIVIGETAVIGNHVKIYQNVTLGALSVNKADAAVKRHPTIEDHVVIYAGATILGGNTVIGHHSVIGGNVWLTRSVTPHSKIYYQAKMYNDVTQDTDLIIFKTS
ncbi:serine O-acetyltransferase [Catalinimonas alkaloidigena]|uniref:Serine acetyltransferase n=1 Tax=Catalinimonas alkaloidigena TaxID=1075417 RepID=A0A1G9KHD8_9BACT|nr:serine acetyltransferase [Catalinimonas alkaloidigena]SDL48825.1 serine O-acetyltransferase [Catalinimonas alkaloidigena]